MAKAVKDMTCEELMEYCAQNTERWDASLRRYVARKYLAEKSQRQLRKEPAPYFLDEIKAINRSPWQPETVIQYLHQKKLEHGWVWIENQA